VTVAGLLHANADYLADSLGRQLRRNDCARAADALCAVLRSCALDALPALEGLLREAFDTLDVLEASGGSGGGGLVMLPVVALLVERLAVWCPPPSQPISEHEGMHSSRQVTANSVSCGLTSIGKQSTSHCLSPSK
jgi:hypothetical protein